MNKEMKNFQKCQNCVRYAWSTLSPSYCNYFIWQTSLEDDVKESVQDVMGVEDEQTKVEDKDG